MPVVQKQRVVKKPTKKARRKRVMSVLDRIEPLNVDGYVKANFYGRSGTGKTTLWSTFPSPILAMLCSGGKRPGELKSINTPENRERIKQVRIEKSSDLTELVEHQESTGEFKTVVLDHATDFQQLVLKEILGVDRLPEQSSWGLATRNQYGQVGLQVKERLRGLLDLNCHIVIVAQERDFNNDDNDDDGIITPFVASAMSPSIVGWLNSACDYICETYIRPKMITKKVKLGKKVREKQVPGKGVEYCLRVAPSSVYTTKFRMPKGKSYPDAIVDPNFAKIKSLIDKGV